MRVLCAFLCGLVGSLAFGWWGFPRLLYKSEPQPLAYNHRVHGEKGSLECSGCHEVAADGQFAGIPRTESCAVCHGETLGKSEAERTLVTRYVGPGREIEWKVYSRQPANARFSHAIHVNKAGMKCEECHGGRGTTTTAEPFVRNRITGESRNIWGPRMVRVGLKPGEGMKMSDCEACHESRGVDAGCLGCHR
jgi:menaquinone reductase, multiheme cytochrome c subunit